MPKLTRRPVQLLPQYKRRSGLFYVGGEYRADIKTDDGRHIRRKFGADKTRALRLFDDLVATLAEEARDEDDPPLRGFLIDVFLPTQERLKSYARSKETVQSVVRFLDDKEPRLRLSDVGPQHIERLRQFYAHLAPRTVNMATQKLKQALYRAVDLGLLDANPLARVKALTVDNRRTRFLSMDDFTRLLHEARGTDAHDVFLTIGLTGLRPSNVRLLTADEVDGGMLRIPAAKMKNGRQGIVPLSRYARDVLARQTPDPLYFPAKGHADRPKGLRNVQRAFYRAGERAGLDWASLYDLRHFYASQLARHGATEQQIGALLCHVGQSVTARYVHHDLDDLRRFVDAHGEAVRDASGELPDLEYVEDTDAVRV